ncbi:hypothetical protein Tco_1218599 [Tanacetum coccineum]
MKQITPLDLLGDMKREHALSNAPSLLPRATSTITGNFINNQYNIQLDRFGMLPCSLISILAPHHTTVNEDVVNDADHPKDYVEPKTNKPSRDTWFKQPPRSPTPDPEWSKRQVVTDQPEQPLFNHMVFAAKDPLTFDELMATPIDFSKYAMNRLQIDNLT